MNDDTRAIVEELRALRAEFASPPRLMTDREVCDHLQITERTLRRYIALVGDRELPGAPIDLSLGDCRSQRRWDPRTVATWFSAARELRDASSAPPAPPPPRPKPKTRPKSAARSRSDPRELARKAAERARSTKGAA